MGPRNRSESAIENAHPWNHQYHILTPAYTPSVDSETLAAWRQAPCSVGPPLRQAGYVRDALYVKFVRCSSHVAMLQVAMLQCTLYPGATILAPYVCAM